MIKWNEFVSGAKKVLNKAVIKVSEVADCAADSIKTETLKIKLCERYEELGRIVYSGIKDEKADKEKIGNKIDEIEAIASKISAIKEKKRKKEDDDTAEACEENIADNA
jgi:SMC interacting uncharacterized protein involved in chromosome segregation